jgi:short-subunit dehydrogenase involved in D-alanine esterification of teichoic acids
VADKLSVDAAVEDIIKAYGHIGVLINCARINKREGLLDVEEETCDRKKSCLTMHHATLIMRATA